MEPIRIKAMFIGSASLGYETGTTYDLCLTTEENFQPWKRQQIVIWGAKDPEKQRICKYDSIFKFFENWGLATTKGMSALLNSIRVMEDTEHRYIVALLQDALGKEELYAQKPSARLTPQIFENGITEQDITNSRLRATESIKQFQKAIALFGNNKFVVGSNDIEIALADYASSIFGEKDANVFAREFIKKLESYKNGTS